MSPEFGIGYTDKGSVVLLPTFGESVVGRARPVDRAVYLWLAQQANHPTFTKQLDGKVITVERGAWFGSRINLAKAVGLDKKTMARSLANLEAIGAVSIAAVERRQRYRNSPVNGGEIEPLNGGEITPQRSGNRTDVRCLGTLIKVHGWKDFANSALRAGNGPKFPPQVSTSQRAASGVRRPRLSARQIEENERAMALVRSGSL